MSSIISEWEDDDHRIIRTTYGRGWGSGDFMVNNTMVQEMMSTVDHSVDVIMDFREAAIPASMANMLPTLAAEKPHPNSGLIVILGTDSFLIHLWDIFKSMYRQVARRVTIVKTLDEAYTFIAERHAESPPNN